MERRDEAGLSDGKNKSFLKRLMTKSQGNFRFNRTNGDQIGDKLAAITIVCVCSIKCAGFPYKEHRKRSLYQISYLITPSDVAIRLLYKPHTAINTRRVTSERNITPGPEQPFEMAPHESSASTNELL